MQRRVFDFITSIGGAVIAVVLVVAGVLCLIGHNYANGQVRDQLAQQQIYFPPQSVWAHATKNNTGEIQARMIPYLQKYSGQELLTGPQAEAYANHFIAYHLAGMPDGGVYSKLSAAAMTAKPGSAQATLYKTLEQTSFQGTTLRGLLLEAYGFWKLGQVALWGAIASFILAAIMAVLAALGVAHAGKVAPEEEMFARRQATPKAAVPVS